MKKVKGKVVLVTGAARGLGAGTAEALAKKGAKLILVDVEAAPLNELAEKIGHHSAIAIQADVTDLAAMEAAVAEGAARFGAIDLVLANAGIASYGSVMAIDPAAFQRVIDVNLMGAFNTARAALPHLIASRGYILIVSSAAAFAAAPGMAPYDASKAGVEHFAHSLRFEVAHHGVDVGIAHMLWIDTDMVREAKRELSSFGEMLESMPGPLSKTTSAEVCIKSFTNGLIKRKRRVYVPGWVWVLRWSKPVLSTKIGELQVLRSAKQMITKMDHEVEVLGRSMSERVAGLKVEDRS